MSDRDSSRLRGLRTFAQDLQSERAKRDGSSPAAPEAEAEATDAPNAKPERDTPPEATENAAPAPTPEDASPQPPKPVAIPKAVPKPIPKSEPAEPAEPVHIPDSPTVQPSKGAAERPDPERTIPSFHELQQTVDTITTVNPKQAKAKQKAKRKEQRAARERAKERTERKRPNIGYDSTVIRDTKSDRFKFFPSVLASIKSWFRSLAPKRSAKTPTYGVPETNRRKGVIERATSQSGATFTSENEALRDRIKRRQAESEAEADDTPTPDTAQETAAPETIWTPYTDTGYPLLTEPDEEPVADPTGNVVVEYRRRQSEEAEPTPEMGVPAVPAATPEDHDDRESAPEPVPDTKEEEPELDPDEARWASSAEPEVAPMTDTPEPEPVPEAEAEAETSPTPEPTPEPEPASVAEPVPEPTDAPLAPEPEPRTPNEPRSFDRFDTNTLTIAILVLVIIMVGIGFIGHIVYDRFFVSTEEAPPTETSYTPLLAGATVEPITLTGTSLEQLPSLIRDAAASSGPHVTEFVVVSPVGDEVSPSYLFEVLRFRTVPSLRQSITSVRFASVDQSTPSMVFQYVDEDTIRGGMLTWEKNALEDLRVLYPDLPLPFELNRRFEDATVSDRDVRVLTDDAGAVLLMYGFVGGNTAVLTHDRDEFTRLIESSVGQ